MWPGCYGVRMDLIWEQRHKDDNPPCPILWQAGVGFALIHLSRVPRHPGVYTIVLHFAENKKKRPIFIMAGFEWELEPDGGEIEVKCSWNPCKWQNLLAMERGCEVIICATHGSLCISMDWRISGIAEILVDVLEEEQIIIFTSIANGITVH